MFRYSRLIPVFSIAVIALPAQAELVNVIEFYHATLNHYFRTADAVEATAIDSGAAGAGWVRTGDNFQAYPAGAIPSGGAAVCRFYGSISPGPNSHFYTASQSECDGLKALQLSTPSTQKRWNYEGLAFAVKLPAAAGCASDSTPIYRLYNNGAAKGEDSNHRYTTLPSEYQRLQSAGWAGEGVVMCSAAVAAPLTLSIGNVNGKTVGAGSFSSSTKLSATWSKPSGYSVDHYLITASEASGNSSVSFSAAASDSSGVLGDLKSGTSYSVTITPCINAACTQTGSAVSASGKTSEEYWQLQGSGATVAGLTKVVSDGNVRIAVLRYGGDAPDALKNRLQLYYGPSSLGAASGLATALTAATVEAGGTGYLSFSSAAGSSGLQNPSSAATLVKEVNAGQALPLSSAAGGYVRIYFEANGSDGKARILSINSRDGYVGKDFNAGSSTVCQSAADYSAGGGCEPTVVIPVEGDVNGNSKISNARQFKIGYPMQDDWRWNEAVGSFMVLTVDPISGCTTAMHNQAYAIWNGSKWVVQYDSAGCPRLMKEMQAATPLHLGGARYKLYYGDTTDTSGRIASSKLPFLGPKKVLYADGGKSGGATTVEFDDWESTATARNLNFLWPNGDLMSSTAEGYIDDFMVVAPTGSLDFQVYYLAITDGTIPPFSAAALLLNP